MTSSDVAQFTGTAFGSAAIWQYESLKSRVQTYFEAARADWLDKMRPQKRGDFRKQVLGAGPSLFPNGWVPAEPRTRACLSLTVGTAGTTDAWPVDPDL